MITTIEKRYDGIFKADRTEVKANPKNKRLDPAELFRAFKKTALDSILDCYEIEARKKLTERGFKFKDARKAYLTAASKNTDKFTFDLLTILFRAAEVRANITEKNASAAAWNAIELCRAAERAEIRPIEPAIRHRFRLSAAGRERAKDIQRARKEEWEKWQGCADQLQQTRVYECKTDLARAVKRRLELTDSIETIRKKVVIKKFGKVP